MAETVLAKMAVEISANAANFSKSLNSVDGRLKSFTSGLKDVAGTVGVAFGVSAVANFAFEVAKLAGEAEGVRAAFEKLPDSEALMSRLKDATAGTVSELELMKRTVQATNFGISLESLPQLLEFAAVRAQQTGQSVDYLVDSIVTGIGRKSPLILDNLGISAVKLKEQMGGVALATADIGEVSAAVGRIASEELEKMGGFSENTATKVARLSASWENFKVTLGNVANSSGVLATGLNILTNTLGAISGDQFTKGFNELLSNMGKGSEQLEKFAAAGGKIDLSWQDLLSQGFVRTEGAAKKYEKILAEIALAQKNLSLAQIEVDPATGLPVGGGSRWVPSMAQKQIDSLESLQEKVKQLNEQFNVTDVTDQKRLANLGTEIIGINAQIKVLEELRKAREGANITTPNTVDAYQSALKDLNEQLEKTNVNDTSRIRILSAQISGYEQAISKVNDLKRSFQGLGEIVLTPPDISGLLDPIKTITESAGALTFETEVTAFEAVVQRFEAGLDKMAQKSDTATEQIKGAFIDMGPLVSGAISGVAESLGQAAVGAGNFGQDILKLVAGFAKQLGEILIATGVGMLAAKKLITNPYTAIIAGAILVGLGAAASAAISSSHKKSFGGGSSGGASGATSTGRVSAFSGNSSNERRIDLAGKFRVDGRDLVLALDNNSIFNNRVG